MDDPDLLVIPKRSQRGFGIRLQVAPLTTVLLLSVVLPTTKSNHPIIRANRTPTHLVQADLWCSLLFLSFARCADVVPISLEFPYCLDTCAATTILLCCDTGQPNENNLWQRCLLMARMVI